jgi:predicted amidophosphoribosyltransferase
MVDGVHEFTVSGVIVHNCVWALTELRGITEGSYMAAYGWRYCKSCGKSMRTSTRLCPGCGKIQDSSDDQTPTAGKWAGAYLNHCKKCGENYPQRFKKCPTCNPTPETYMAAVQKASGQGGSWLSYSGRDWFKGAGLLSDTR